MSVQKAIPRYLIFYPAGSASHLAAESQRVLLRSIGPWLRLKPSPKPWVSIDRTLQPSSVSRRNLIGGRRVRWRGCQPPPAIRRKCAGMMCAPAEAACCCCFVADIHLTHSTDFAATSTWVLFARHLAHKIRLSALIAIQPCHVDRLPISPPDTRQLLRATNDMSALPPS